MTNYRISFDYAAENPTDAIIYLLGVIEDPNPDIQNLKFDWLVTDLSTGEQRKLSYSLNDLNEIARRKNKEFLDGLRGE